MKVISNFLPKKRAGEWDGDTGAAKGNTPQTLSDSASGNNTASGTALQLWRSSLLTLSEAMPLSPKQISEPHRRGLRMLVDDLPANPAAAQLEQKRAKTAELLKSYGSLMGNFIDSQEREAKAVLGSVAQLTETMSGLDQRHSVRLQGITKKLRLLATSNDLADIRAKLSAEVSALEKCLEEQQRDTKAAVHRLMDDVRSSESRRQKILPGAGSAGSASANSFVESLLALDRSVSSWGRYCLVRYEFRDANGSPLEVAEWAGKASLVESAVPERMGQAVHTVSPQAGVLLAAVNCQLLEYAGQAESMERTLSALSGFTCTSRVVEPLRGESLREAIARLERAG